MFKPLTEEEKKMIDKQNENTKKIADALIGKKLIKVNLDTVGPGYFTKGADKKAVESAARNLVSRVRSIHKQNIKLVKVEGNMCELENVAEPEKWKITDVEFIVE